MLKKIKTPGGWGGGFHKPHISHFLGFCLPPGIFAAKCVWRLVFSSVAEPKLFIFGSGSGSPFVHNFGYGSGSSSCHFKLHFNNCTRRNMYKLRFFFILASSKLTAENIYFRKSVGSGSRSQTISAPPAPVPQHWFFLSFSLMIYLGGLTVVFISLKLSDCRM